MLVAVLLLLLLLDSVAKFPRDSGRPIDSVGLLTFGRLAAAAAPIGFAHRQLLFARCKYVTVAAALAAAALELIHLLGWPQCQEEKKTEAICYIGLKTGHCASERREK